MSTTVTKLLRCAHSAASPSSPRQLPDISRLRLTGKLKPSGNDEGSGPSYNSAACGRNARAYALEDTTHDEELDDLERHRPSNEHGTLLIDKVLLSLTHRRRQRRQCRFDRACSILQRHPNFRRPCHTDNRGKVAPTSSLSSLGTRTMTQA